MSTRSTVAIKNLDGSYDAIYCHFDGYIKGGVGDTLREDHNTEAAARAIIEAGDHSTIVNGCSPYFERDDEDWDNVKSQHFTDEADLRAMLSKSWTEFLHTFVIKDGKWIHKQL